MIVNQKQVLGRLGRTAVEHSATHLHFELREGGPEGTRYGDAIDPMPVLNLGGTLPAVAFQAGRDPGNSPGGPELQQQAREKLANLSLPEKWDRRRNLEALMQQLPLSSPIDGDDRISSGFGRRLEPDTGEPGFHPGVDVPGTCLLYTSDAADE